MFDVTWLIVKIGMLDIRIKEQRDAQNCVSFDAGG